MDKISRGDLLVEATRVAESYRDQGYDLTLRQLYYQLVAAAIIPNADEAYKRLGDTLGDARLRGDFDMDLLVDRGRDAQPSKHHECKLDVDDALREAGEWLRALPHWSITADRWFGQPLYVSTWVEKDALSGVFEKPCKDLGVGLFACKGYPSHSALWQWLLGLQEAYKTSLSVVTDDEGTETEPRPINRAVVLYFGDHDPDGWQIPRSAEQTLNTLADVHRLHVPPIRFRRVALLMEQIRQYDPPPFPAKTTSSRFDSYFQEHGTLSAWELDALRPDVLDELIRVNVNGCWDAAIHRQWQGLATANRSRLRLRMKADGWADSVFAKGG